MTQEQLNKGNALDRLIDFRTENADIPELEESFRDSQYAKLEEYSYQELLDMIADEIED